VAAEHVLPVGKATIGFDFAYDGGVGKCGTGTLSVNGKSVARRV
jgi:arylsulfatase